MARRTLLFCAAAALAGGAARADSAIESRLREALRAANSQVQALEEEQAKLKAQKGEQAKELEALKAELASARAAARRAPASASGSAALARKLGAAEEARAQLAGSLERCERTAKEAGEALEGRAQERDQAAARTDAEAARARACEERIGKAVESTRQFLQWLAGPGRRVCEPLLGLRRVEMENRAQELEDRLLELKVAP